MKACERDSFSVKARFNRGLAMKKAQVDLSLFSSNALIEQGIQPIADASSGGWKLPYCMC